MASCSGSSTRAVVASKQQSSQLDHVPPRWQPGPGGGGSSSGASNARGAAAARCPGDGEAVGQSVVCTCVGVGVGWSLGRACTSARARAALRVYCVWALFACGRRTAQSQLNCWSALTPPHRPRTAASHLYLTTPPTIHDIIRAITSETRAWATALNAPLQQTDPDLYAIIEKEKVRQRDSLVLIASENFTSKYVRWVWGGLLGMGNRADRCVAPVVQP